MDDSQPSRITWSGSFFRCVLAVLVFLILVYYVFLGGWPPTWMVRRDQRKMLFERVQAAGGWAALQQACDAFVQTNQDTALDWYRGFDTNALPPAIVALKPSEVRFYAPKMVRGSVFATEFDVVQIKVFGLHHTGGRADPYYGLEVVAGTNTGAYTPRPSLGGASGNGYNAYRKITDSIYEIYGPD